MMFSNSAGTVPTCSTALKSSDEGRNVPTLHEVGIKSRNKAHKVKSAVLFTEGHPFRESAEIPLKFPGALSFGWPDGSERIVHTVEKRLRAPAGHFVAAVFVHRRIEVSPCLSEFRVVRRSGLA